ncbi:MAG: STAS-like domain-containing protein [Chitinispirillia bacterium]|nr:STAS-like domain-containing protein [Chitinispirillia bacterium]MCL2267834.1 STAS-like domain-containing protein [Chitinispirillia bacterium]
MKIKIAKDFSRIPGARLPEEGDFSGQEFRQQILLPKLREAIEKKIKLEIDLDGTAGLGTSFLEESFGGLIRIDKMDYNLVKGTLLFISNDDPEYIDEIYHYLKDAYEKETN